MMGYFGLFRELFKVQDGILSIIYKTYLSGTYFE